MANKVIIVESPSKSKTISSYLNNEYEVYSSKGHIRDLATSGVGGLGIDVNHDFEPTYKVLPDKSVLVKDLIKKTKGKEVYLATDPDREGEAIAWHLANVLELDLNDKNRIIFREITKPAILEAINKPSTIDMELVNSQETRRKLDRIIGFKLSTLLQRKIKSKSAGRVQSVALKLICDLEKERLAFIPEEYHNIKAIFDNFEADYQVKKDHRIKEAEAKKIVEESINPFTVSKVDSKETKKSAKAPFITSTLQQDAINNLSMNSSRTMMVAQKLYEGVQIGEELIGLITYMRTDSTRLSDIYVKEAQDHILNNYGKDYLGTYKITKSNQAQDAHEAIRPTSINRTPESVKEHLSADEYKLYKRIYNRTLASLMSDAKFMTKKVILETNNHKYEVNGVINTFLGYLKVYDDAQKDKIIPDFKENEKYNANEISCEKKFTLPPARYSEATLIKELEAQGIGRPSTYATIIRTLKSRFYVELEEKRFKPTEQGMLTNDELEKFFNSIINVQYTSNMEQELDEISSGKVDGNILLKDFYHRFTPLLDNADQNMDKVGPKHTGENCPLCESPLVFRNGPKGPFIGCSNFPKCKHTQQVIKNNDKP